MNDSFKPRKLLMAAYLLPSFFTYLFIFILPSIMSIILSFFKFSSIKAFRFIGFQNYLMLLKDSNIWLALKNNLFLVFTCMIGQIGIAFVLSCLLNSRLTYLSTPLRTIIYFPVTLSAVVIGYVWKFVFDYNYGLITYFCNFVGKEEWIRPWLSDGNTIMWFICIPMIWQYVGFHIVIMMSAMSSIDPSIYEMAEIDGATGFQKATKITLPLIKSTLFVCVWLCISANMKAFDHILSMTNGGPGMSSNVLSLYAYTVAFRNSNMGYGSAVSVFILAITSLLFALSQIVKNAIAEKE